MSGARTSIDADPASGSDQVPGAGPVSGGGRTAANPGEPFDREWVLAPHADPAEVGRAVVDLESRATSRLITASYEVQQLLRALRCIDLTTLAADDTPRTVRDLCAVAREPLPAALGERLGVVAAEARVAAVCVYPYFLPVALDALEGSGIPVAVAAAGFPAGLSPLSARIEEIRSSVDAGAQEIDVVINRSLVLTGAWEELYDEVRSFREACGPLPMKVILATGELRSLENVARTARLCMQAGADFIKTSTGKEAVNATYPAGLVMLREIAAYREQTGRAVGFKPAGGIRAPGQALAWMRLVEETLGADWARPARFRLGASALLDSIRLRLSSLAEPT